MPARPARSDAGTGRPCRRRRRARRTARPGSRGKCPPGRDTGPCRPGRRCRERWCSTHRHEGRTTMNSTITTARVHHPTARHDHGPDRRTGLAPPALGLGRRRGRPGRHRLDRRLDAGRRRLRPRRRGRPRRDRGPARRRRPPPSSPSTRRRSSSMALLVVFAAGLRRRLAGQLPVAQPAAGRRRRGPRPGRRRPADGLRAHDRVRLRGQRPRRRRRPRGRGLLRPLGRHHPVAVGRRRHSPVSPWPSPPCGTARPRAGSAGSGPCSAASPSSSGSRRCSTWPA